VGIEESKGARMNASSSWTLTVSQTEEFRDLAFEVARRQGAPRDVADDVAQITILRLMEAADRSPTVTSVLASDKAPGYVTTATRNVLAGYHRSESRRLRREETAFYSDQRLVAETSELEQQLGVMMIEELATALLTPEEQAIIHLRYFQGRTTAEIAEMLDTTPGRVSHVGRAANRKIQRALLDD
jgi:RNA polymerase sigma factor (sigma-70 family)